MYAQEMKLVVTLRARFSGESMWIYREVRALQHRATSGVALGLDARALQDYDTALRLFRPLVEQDPKNRSWQVELAGLEQDRLRIEARHVADSSILPALADLHVKFQRLLAFDPKNTEWAQREAVAHLRMATAMPLNSTTQQEQVDAALTKMKALHINNPSDLSARLVLIDGLLRRATIQHARNEASFILNCEQARAIIGDKFRKTNNYTALSLWVRINVCLRQPEKSKVEIARLSEIGYRDTQYMQMMSK